MKGRLPILVASLATCMSMYAEVNMYVVKQDGNVMKFDAETIQEVVFEEDNSIPFEYKILSDSTVEVIKGDYGDYPTIVIPETAEIDGKTYNVTSIGGYAFSDLTSLTSVTIPEGVSNIRWDAFYGCTALTEVILPESLDSIQDCAFMDCSSLTSITIPENVTSISPSAFSSTGLPTGLLIYNHGTKCAGWIGNEQECTSVVIPDGVKEIGDQAFYKVFYNLTSITIPESLESIGEMAFAGSGLTSIVLPASLKKLGYGAFMYCDKLEAEIHALKENVEIGKNALDDCKSVTWVK